MAISRWEPGRGALPLPQVVTDLMTQSFCVADLRPGHSFCWPAEAVMNVSRAVRSGVLHAERSHWGRSASQHL